MKFIMQIGYTNMHAYFCNYYFSRCYSFFFFFQISNAEFALVQAVQENANLRSKIVQSPDKLQVFLSLNKYVILIHKTGTTLMLILSKI